MAREPFVGSRRQRARRALTEAMQAERGVAGAVKRKTAQVEERARGAGLLPKVLIGLGCVLVLAGVLFLAGGPPSIAFDSSELEAQPGVAVAAPFEKLHAAQKAKIRKAMNAPFVLGVPRAKLERIAECESHGDPRAIGGGGLYRGKYQFHRGTWASVGGTGDPARASELEQDRRAAMLLKQSGSSPWPICG